MSYIKEIGGYTVKFKDEVSYLEVRLERLKSFDDISLIGFLRHEMYDKSKCEMESIEPIPTATRGYIWDFTGTLGNSNSVININSDIENPLTDPNNFHYQYVPTDNDGWAVDYLGQWISGNSGEIVPSSLEQTNINKEEKKETKPTSDDPIKSRFDILDL